MSEETHFVKSKRSIKVYASGSEALSGSGQMICLGYIDYVPADKEYCFNQRILVRNVSAEHLNAVAKKLNELNK